MAEDQTTRAEGWRIALAIVAAFALLLILWIDGRVGPFAAFLLFGAFAALLLWIDSLHRATARRLAAAIRQARAQKRRSGPLRAKFAEGIDTPLLLIDPQRKLCDANRAARDLFGERIVGRDIGLHVRHPDILAALEDVIAGARTRSEEVTISGPVDRVFSVRIARVENRMAGAAGEAGDDGAEDEPPFHIVISMFEITQIKAAERMRADFVANASHELRTPLSSVIGFIETLRGPARGDAEASERFLSIMHDEARRMSRLIDDLLSLSKIELDKHLQPRGAVDIAGLMQSVANSMEPAATARGLSLALAIPDRLPPARGDADQLHQLLQNLVANAIKYSEGPGQIRLGAEADIRIPETGNRGIRLSVADEGPGIAPEHIPRLTERFYRVDAARSRQLGGTGLGLAIVKHIVGRHRGHLEIRSTLGKGTTVSATIPIYEDRTMTGDDGRPANGPEPL
ncbi:MAG: ATP-binding protein [Rhodothalassiaceae bacterium]